MWMAGLVYVLQVQGRAKEINGRLGKTVKIQPRFSQGSAEAGAFLGMSSCLF